MSRRRRVIKQKASHALWETTSKTAQPGNNKQWSVFHCVQKYEGSHKNMYKTSVFMLRFKHKGRFKGRNVPSTREDVRLWTPSFTTVKIMK